MSNKNIFIFLLTAVLTGGALAHHVGITITPASPSSSDPIVVRADFSVGALVETQGYSISGNTVSVWFYQDGFDFSPNPPHSAEQEIPPLPPGEYRFEIVAGHTEPQIFYIVVRANHAAHAIPALTKLGVLQLALMVLVVGFLGFIKQRRQR